MSISWSKENEAALLQYRKSGMKFDDIAKKLDSTASAIKHKIRRISQNNNLEKHHHPLEKIEQVRRYLKNDDNYILETNCGWGNLTKIYQEYGEVLCFDIDKKRIQHVKEMQMQDVYAEHADSFLELHRLVSSKCEFNVIDLDPYGFPSRYFPHVFLLINKGYLFLTIPKLGVQKINKITARHLECFWGIYQWNRKDYEDVIVKKVAEYGMQNYREVVLSETLSIGGVYRMVFRVEKKSSLALVGLNVCRNPVLTKTSNELMLF